MSYEERVKELHEQNIYFLEDTWLEDMESLSWGGTGKDKETVKI